MISLVGILAYIFSIDAYVCSPPFFLAFTTFCFFKDLRSNWSKGTDFHYSTRKGVKHFFKYLLNICTAFPSLELYLFSVKRVKFNWHSLKQNFKKQYPYERFILSCKFIILILILANNILLTFLLLIIIQHWI